MVSGLDLRDRQVLDIGCGIGGPALLLADQYGANVLGIDLEQPLISRARATAEQRNLSHRVQFKTVSVGPLPCDDESVDVVYGAGAFTQVEDKAGMFSECLRVLRPGGVLTCYDWTKSAGEYSPQMRYWFKMEGLTYAMLTLDEHGELLRQAGFTEIHLTDASRWYRERANVEYEQLRESLYPRMLELMPREQADYFVENWRALTVVCNSGEMRQGFYRGTKRAA